MCKLKIWPKPSQDWNTQPHVESWILQKTSPYADLFGENHRATSNRTDPDNSSSDCHMNRTGNMTGTLPDWVQTFLPHPITSLPSPGFSIHSTKKFEMKKVQHPEKKPFDEQSVRSPRSPRCPSLGGGSNVLVPSSFNRTKASAVVRPSGTLKVPPEGPGWVVNKAVFSEAMKLQSLKGTGICRTWEHAEKMM